MKFATAAVLILTAVPAALACCKQKGITSCCGKGKCNIFCCNCDGGTSGQPPFISPSTHTQKPRKSQIVFILLTLRVSQAAGTIAVPTCPSAGRPVVRMSSAPGPRAPRRCRRYRPNWTWSRVPSDPASPASRLRSAVPRMSKSLTRSTSTARASSPTASSWTFPASRTLRSSRSILQSKLNSRLS